MDLAAEAPLLRQRTSDSFRAPDKRQYTLAIAFRRIGHYPVEFCDQLGRFFPHRQAPVLDLRDQAACSTYLALDRVEHHIVEGGNTQQHSRP